MNEGKVKDTVTDLVNGLEEAKQDKHIAQVKSADTLLGLRDSIAGFITGQLDLLNEEREFETLLKEAIKVKLDDPTTKLSDLAGLLNQSRMRKTDLTESLLNFFKPTQGDKSPLISEREEEGSAGERAFEGTDSDTLRKLDQILQAVNSKESPKPKIVDQDE